MTGFLEYLCVNSSPNYRVENWMTPSDGAKVEYADYWNDEEADKRKAWYVDDEGSFKDLEGHLGRVGWPADLENCIHVLNARLGRPLAGTGIDLAAGNLWPAPHLFRLGSVEKLYALEFSQHRIFKSATKVLRHYGVPHDKVVLVFGSFYDLHLPDDALDFVFLSAAFHHADKPGDLLEEIRRVLKPHGAVIIIGEHVVSLPVFYAKHTAKYVISKFVPASVQKMLFRKVFSSRKLLVTRSELLAPDSIVGDHYYTLRDYRRMFSAHGFRSVRVRGTSRKFQSFVLVKDPMLRGSDPADLA